MRVLSKRIFAEKGGLGHQVRGAGVLGPCVTGADGELSREAVSETLYLFCFIIR